MTAMPCAGCRDTHFVKDLDLAVERPCAVCRDVEYEAWCATLRPRTRRVARLDEKGRCCGRKPLSYKRDGYLYCTRCNAAFDILTRHQIVNWAWQQDGDVFVAKRPAPEIARLTRRAAPEARSDG